MTEHHLDKAKRLSKKQKEFVMRHQLQKLLKEHDISAAQLARQCGIAKQVISDWLAGAKPKHIDKVKMIADFFQVSIDELCFGEANNQHVEKKNAQAFESSEIVQQGRYEIIVKRIKEE